MTATEDLAAALSVIFENAETLEAGTGITRSGAVRRASGWPPASGQREPPLSEVTTCRNRPLSSGRIPASPAFPGTTPPTFVTVSEDDRIVDVPTVERRVEGMRNAGIEVEYRQYRHAGPGFVIGCGTDAGGWIVQAIRF